MTTWMKLLHIAGLVACTMHFAHAAVPKNLEVAVQSVQKGDTAQAIRHLLPLAKNGDAEAQFMLVSLLRSTDAKQSNHWLVAAANNKHPAASHILGLMYLQGNGVAENLQLALKWLKIAAEGGVTAAQLQLGQFYRSGPNSIQDDNEALKWISKAATAGNMDAQFKLAEMYQFGYGVPTDGAERKKWLQRAADQGHEQAVKLLGQLR